MQLGTLGNKFPTILSPGKNSHGPNNPPFRQHFSHLERMHTGLTIHFFKNTTLTWREMHTSMTTHFFNLIPNKSHFKHPQVKMEMEVVSTAAPRRWCEWWRERNHYGMIEWMEKCNYVFYFICMFMKCHLSLLKLPFELVGDSFPFSKDLGQKSCSCLFPFLEIFY